MIIFSGIVAAIIFYLVCKNVCPGKSPFSRHLGRTRVVNIPGLVSSNNTGKSTVISTIFVGINFRGFGEKLTHSSYVNLYHITLSIKHIDY